MKSPNRKVMRGSSPINRSWLRAAVPLLGLTQALMGAGSVWALGVGKIESHSQLGQPLKLSLPLQLSKGETISAECLQVEVMVGDDKLPGALLQTDLGAQSAHGVRLLHVESTGRIDEPMIQVRLTLVCPLRMTRQFVVMLDPPGFHLGDNALAALDAAGQDVSTAVVTASTTSATPLAHRAGREKGGRQERTGSGRRDVSGQAHVGSQPLTKRPGALSPQRLAASEPTGAQLRLEAPSMGLRLFQFDNTLGPQGTAPSDDSAIGLERQLAQLREQQARTAQRAALLQQQLAAKDSEPKLDMLHWLLGGGSALFAALSVFLWVRQRRVAKHWLEDDGEVAATPAEPKPQEFDPAVKVAQVDGKLSSGPSGVSKVVRPALGGSFSLQAPDVAVNEGRDEPVTYPGDPYHDQAVRQAEPHSVEPQFARAELQPFEVQATEAPQLSKISLDFSQDQEQPVNVDGLLDLEQQVEFFKVLGQEEAAIELLSQKMAAYKHVSGLPYLRLLQLLKQHNDHQNFDAVALRFATEFKAPLPQWDEDLESGAGLESQAELLSHVQSGWRDSKNMLLLLNDLLTQPNPLTSQLDLQCYGDLLMLYCVSKDLAEHPQQHLVDDFSVDVLLPLSGAEGARPVFNVDSGLEVDLPLDIDLPVVELPKVDMPKVDYPQASAFPAKALDVEFDFQLEPKLPSPVGSKDI
ncbi:FimV family protein [Roseateles sp. BYS180W]|uniref:FimV family protein n=1 Tax=Roseateles rivi TaxID=3299028 RepID=A0ABW7FXT4_9BURK